MALNESFTSKGQLNGNCPPGMESLLPLSFLRVQFEPKNGTVRLLNVFDLSGNHLFQAVERSDKPWFGFGYFTTTKVLNPSGQVVLIVHRKCNTFITKAKVTTGDGTNVGTLKSNCFCCCCCTDITCCFSETYSVYNTEKQKVMKIKKPRGCCDECDDPRFTITNMEEREIGALQRRWDDMFMQSSSLYDNFGIRFPEELDGYQKALIFATIFLVNAHYEKRDTRTNSYNENE